MVCSKVVEPLLVFACAPLPERNEAGLSLGVVVTFDVLEDVALKGVGFQVKTRVSNSRPYP